VANRREAISKKSRFEVFKRDGFKCQYCGRSAPEVILEVDHIKAVANKGKSDIMNLITSCRDCNRGKGKITLSDNSEIKKQKKQLEDINEKRLQLEMMIRWREELRDMNERLCDSICEHFYYATGSTITEEGKLSIKRLLTTFSIDEIYDAIDAGVETYGRYGRENLAGKIFDKLGGICYNRRHKINGNPKIY